MKKLVSQKLLFSLPGTQTILGTHIKGRENFMALGWLTRVNYLPPMLGVCVNKKNASHEGILEYGEFSINVPSRKEIEITDYSGMVSAYQTDKSDLFEVFYGDLEAAPLIKECPMNIECKLTQSVELPTNYFFIAEIINIYADENCLTDGELDIKLIDPFMLTMPDNKFWSIGEEVGKAWHDGREILKKLSRTREI